MPPRPKRQNWIPTIEDCAPSLLRTFLVFVEEGTVSQAAEALKLDKPTVSRRLQAFTSGNPRHALLERIGERRLQLTERGRDLLPTIRSVLFRYEELLDHVRGRQDAVESVRLGLGSFAAQLYLPQVLAHATKRPLWQLEARLMRGRDRILGVAEGRLDLAVVTHAPGDIEGLAVNRLPLAIERLVRHRLAVIAHPHTKFGQELAALDANRAMTLAKLARTPLVGLDEQSGLRQELQRQLGRPNALNVVHEHQPGGWAIGREYARHQLGAALLPLPLLTAQDRHDFIVRHLSSTFGIEEHLIVRKGELTQGQSEVKQYFQEVARSLPSTT